MPRADQDCHQRCRRASLLLILMAMICESAARSTNSTGLSGRTFTQHPGLFGGNHTRLLELLGQKLSDQFEWLDHFQGHAHHARHHYPGWLPNILNPLVRAAFPEANAYYLASYASNVTFDGPGYNRTHPMDPSYKIPTIQPPAKRTVPAYNPEHNSTLAQAQQGPGPDATAVNTSTNTSDTIATKLYSTAGFPQQVLQAAPKSSLTSGQQLQQGVALYSPNGTVFLVAQPDGNLVLYNTARYAVYGASIQAAIWASNTYGAAPPPFVLNMQGDCNLVLYNGNGNDAPDAVWSSDTSYGIPPCAMSVADADGGYFQVADARLLLYRQPKPLVPPIAAGMWRTPHPDPDPLDGPTTGLSGAVAVAMAYLPDGTVVFTERPHPLAPGIPNNPLIVDADNVGSVGSLYTVSYFGQFVPGGDTFAALDVQSQAFCVGVTVDSLGNAIMVGGDNQCAGCLFRTLAEESSGIPYPNGYYDVRRFAPGAASTGMTVPARMFDVNSVTGLANTARDCCIQLPNDPQPIPESCVPDSNCSPRWYPTLLTLPSGNILIVGGCLVTGGGYAAELQNPTWQIYNAVTQELTYNKPFPTSILTDQVPYSLYPLMWVLPHTGSVLMLDGVAGEILAMDGDNLLGLDTTYTNPPNVAWPLTFGNIAASVLLPLKYPDYTAEVLVLGGSDDLGNGLSYSQRLSNLAPGQTPSWTLEPMQGQARIEGTGVLLPDGTVFLCSGAERGYVGGTFNNDNAYGSFTTAPQIYTPTAPLGQRWSGLLTDSGIDRGYHNSALLIASGEVMVAGSEPTGEYRVQYYVPPYLLNGTPRPLITSVNSNIPYNTDFTVAYTLQSGTVASVVLIRMTGSTHSVQMDQRMIILNIKTSSKTSLTLLAPPDATIAPPGYYMLFLVSALGTPSIAKFVNVPGLALGPPPPPPMSTGILKSGQSLQQGVRLYSTDNAVYLVAQMDGNLVLYNTTLEATLGASAGAIIWSSGTSNNGPAPFTLIMQAVQPKIPTFVEFLSDCNLVLYNGNLAQTGPVGQSAVWSSATYNQGTPPCSAIVSSVAGGSLAINDAKGIKLFQQPPPPSPGNLKSGQSLQQGVRLYSNDNAVYLVAQNDGNLVLYNTTLEAVLGPSQGAAIWASGTFGNVPAPFTLIMQADCNLVLYNGNLAQTGPVGQSAVWSSATYNQGTPPCSAIVSSVAGGSLAINDAKGIKLFQKP